MIYIGIDPGISGAVGIIKEDGSIEIFDTPFISVGAKNEYNSSEMATILNPYKYCNNCHVFMEKVSAMPKQGVTSMFNFGKGYGIWLGIISAYLLSYTLVRPQVWKKILMQGILDKDASRMRATQLFPAYSRLFLRKKDVGRADALLIAEYGRQNER